MSILKRLNPLKRWNRPLSLFSANTDDIRFLLASSAICVSCLTVVHFGRPVSGLHLTILVCQYRSYKRWNTEWLKPSCASSSRCELPASNISMTFANSWTVRYLLKDCLLKGIQQLILYKLLNIVILKFANRYAGSFDMFENIKWSLIFVWNICWYRCMNIINRN